MNEKLVEMLWGFLDQVRRNDKEVVSSLICFFLSLSSFFFFEGGRVEPTYGKFLQQDHWSPYPHEERRGTFDNTLFPCFSYCIFIDGVLDFWLSARETGTA